MKYQTKLRLSKVAFFLMTAAGIACIAVPLWMVLR
jgi:hypothetical protein